MAKKDLSQLIKPNSKAEPIGPIKMGEAYKLSTDNSGENLGAQERMSTKAPEHKSTSPQKGKKRKAPPSSGARIFPDNIDALKRIALDEKRGFYEILDEAIREYRARKGY